MVRNLEDSIMRYNQNSILIFIICLLHGVLVWSTPCSGLSLYKSDSTRHMIDINLASGYISKDADSTAYDDVLDGFDDKTENSGAGVSKETGKKGAINLPYGAVGSLSGDFKLGSSINFAHEAPGPGETDYRGLSKLKTSLNLELDLNLSQSWQGKITAKAFYDFVYFIQGRDEYTANVIDLYEKELELGETYLQGTLLPNLDVKFGRQIVIWGKSDYVRVTDILNPLDNREFGLADIVDLRLPVTMSKLDYYSGDWNLSGIVVHENRFNKNPPLGSDFFPGLAPLPKEDHLNLSIKNQEYAVALNGIFRGWDLSLYNAYIFDDQAHIEHTFSGPIRKHSRIVMAGSAANVALGNWLLKSEVAYFQGLEFSGLPGEKKSRMDILFGVEYSGFNETNISLEVANRHLFDFDKRLEGSPDYERKNDFQSVFRFTRDFLHDQLKLNFIASTFGISAENGAFQRLQFKYEWTDEVSITVGGIIYQSGNSRMFRHIGDNDRLFFEMKYNF